ncbi:MAG: hydrogenase maturation nickel metallochaperone HypA [Burkholderiales bacterium]|nr:hydrogenase maturation nickel metallochaperone HypA [Burkholderiales bacterium]
MHEMSLMQGVLGILEENAKGAGFSKVKTVWLEIGALSGVDPHAMEFCFDVVMKNTLAENARLEILETPGTAWCMKCGKNVGISARYDPCPECGRFQLEVTGGAEMRVKELEVE